MFIEKRVRSVPAKYGLIKLKLQSIFVCTNLKVKKMKINESFYFLSGLFNHTSNA
jgi:hypothetical protein